MTSHQSDRLAADAFLQAEKYLSAMEIYNRLISQDPRDAQAWVGVGMVMVRTLQWAQAAETFQFVIDELDADNAMALYGQSVALFHLGQTEAAAQAVERACALAPRDWRIYEWRAYVQATLDPDPARIRALYEDWGRRFADPLTARAQPLLALTPERRDATRRLKIGYVSGDLRQHSIAFFMEPVLARHDPQQVDVHVYSTGQRDAFTERIASLVPHWFDVVDLGDAALCDLIRSHEIDVLVDLSGHTVGHRLFTFARRAAPVQVTWLGFMYTLGMQAMDYRFTDGGVSPPGSQAGFTEKLFYLDGMASYIPPAGTPEIGELPMRLHGHPTLISLNNSKKVTDEMLQLWGEILALRPETHLILMAQEIDQDNAVQQMLPRLQRLGLPLDRVVISRQLPLDDFMTLGNLADIALDTYPISGGTTTLHALWMGLPVVALQGTEATSSATATTLQGLGWGEWVAVDRPAYLKKVIDLIDHPQRIEMYRQSMRMRMQNSPLMDYAARARDVERAYRLMWINHLLNCPRYLDVSHDLGLALRSLSDEAQALARGASFCVD